MFLNTYEGLLPIILGLNGSIDPLIKSQSRAFLCKEYPARRDNIAKKRTAVPKRITEQPAKKRR